MHANLKMPPAALTDPSSVKKCNIWINLLFHVEYMQRNPITICEEMKNFVELDTRYSILHKDCYWEKLKKKNWSKPFRDRKAQMRMEKNLYWPNSNNFSWSLDMLECCSKQNFNII